ncbi:MAG: ATP-binding protein [Candidatus Peregrinibacteria bacterium]
MRMIKRSILKTLQKAMADRTMTVLIGSRQVGKTFLMRQLAASLPKKRQNIFLIGDDPEVTEVFETLTRFEGFLRSNGIDPEKPITIFVDEFQLIPEISKKLKWFYDARPRWKFVLSGSSSLNISKNLKEALVGRVTVFPIHPASFEEFLSYKDPGAFKTYQNIKLETLKEFKVPERLREWFNHYLLYGGYPAVVIAKNTDKALETLDNIVRTYIYRDIKAYIKEIKPAHFNHLVTALALQTGNLLSVNNLSQFLGMSYRKVEEYLYFLEELFVIKRVMPFSSKASKEIKKMPKVYFLDTGIRNMVIKVFTEIMHRPDKGGLLENGVFAELNCHLDVLSILRFWRTKQGTEVDLVVRKNEKQILIEIKSRQYQTTPHLLPFGSFENIHGKADQKIIVHMGNDLIRQKNVLLLPACLSGKISTLL